MLRYFKRENVINYSHMATSQPLANYITKRLHLVEQRDKRKRHQKVISLNKNEEFTIYFILT